MVSSLMVHFLCPVTVSKVEQPRERKERSFKIQTYRNDRAVHGNICMLELAKKYRVVTAKKTIKMGEIT